MREDEHLADPEASVAEIDGLIAKYRQSIDNADTDLAAQIWSTTEDVTFIHPRGHQHGWEEIRRNFYERTMGDRFSERRLSIHDVSVHVYGDAAWVEFYWDFVARFRSDGTIHKTAGRETQVYRKEDRGWRLVHVHYSGRPVTGDREGF